jgi:hypothetical protein
MVAGQRKVQMKEGASLQPAACPMAIYSQHMRSARTQMCAHGTHGMPTCVERHGRVARAAHLLQVLGLGLGVRDEGRGLRNFGCQFLVSGLGLGRRVQGVAYRA